MGQCENSLPLFDGKLVEDFSVYNVILACRFALAADSIPQAWRNVRQDWPEVSIKKISSSGIKFDDGDKILFLSNN